MGIQVTVDQLKKIYAEQHSDALLNAMIGPLNKTLEKYKLNENVNEVATFLAQVGHESGQLAYRVENLNYSAQGLTKTFRKYFPTLALANSYARQPIKIANRVYAGRMGNGAESTGDGWKYRGKGGIQITGKENHEKFARWLGINVEDAIKFALTDEGFWVVAAWFWDDRDLDRYDDDLKILKETQMINGGENGLADREHLMARGIKVLG